MGIDKAREYIDKVKRIQYDTVNGEWIDIGYCIDYEDAYKAIEIAAETNWIPVCEKLPDDKQEVLAWSEEDDIIFVYYDAKTNTWNNNFNQAGIFKWVVTHWMSLPKPPEVEEEPFLSPCCGAIVNQDLMLCPECKEHI